MITGRSKIATTENGRRYIKNCHWLILLRRIMQCHRTDRYVSIADLGQCGYGSGGRSAPGTSLGARYGVCGLVCVSGSEGVHAYYSACG